MHVRNSVLITIATVMLVTFATVNCGSEQYAAQPQGTQAEDGCVCPGGDGDGNVTDDSAAPLHDENDIALLNDAGIEAECTMFSIAQYFEIEKEHAKYFQLETAPQVPYCVEVVRSTGYITLSHEEGEVTRDDNSFRWCLTRNASRNSAELVVRSLTPNAAFYIHLMRL